MLKKKHTPGFTLVELLVAIAIIGIISIITVRSLYDIVAIRAKQQSIEDSSDSLRTVARLITKAVIEAQDVNVANPWEIQITGEASCHTIKYDPAATAVLYAEEFGGSCSPPNSGFAAVTSGDMVITAFSLSPVGSDAKVITLEMEGVNKNSLGDHPVKYKTTITPRI